MKLKKTKLFLFVVFIFICLSIFYKQKKININNIDKNKIESFDLIIAKGQSLQSKIINLFGLTIKNYSHIGILIKTNNKLFVLHSTPDGVKENGIRYDELKTFIDLSNFYDCKILRYHSMTLQNRVELTYAINYYKSIKKPFDFAFDNFNNDKIYCSELVYLVFREANLIELNTFNLTKPIYPKFFLENNDFISINFLKK